MPWEWIDWIFYLTPTGRQFKNDLKIMDDFVDSVISKRKRFIVQAAKTTDSNENVQSDSTDSKCVDGKVTSSDLSAQAKVQNLAEVHKNRRKVFLDMLLETHLKDPNLLSDLEMRWEVNTFMFAGQDTTSSAITFTLYFLGLHEDFQQKVFDEIQDVLGDDGEVSSSILSRNDSSILSNPLNSPFNPQITQETLKELKYLDWVIKETLRLVPSVIFGFRKLDSDFQVGPYRIPEGVTLFYSIYHIHRDPEIYPDPEAFNPERWAQNPPNYAYLPFSAGPRNCIGQKFALLEMKTVVTNVIRSFKVTSLVPKEEMRYGLEVVLRPKVPVKMKLTKR